MKENQGGSLAAAGFDQADFPKRRFDAAHAGEVNGGVKLCNSGFAGETVKHPLICIGAPFVVTLPR